MAWSSIGKAGGIGRAATVGDTSIPLTGIAGSGANVGDLLVLTWSATVVSTTSGATTIVNSISDSAGTTNVWNKIGEYASGGTGSLLPCLNSQWYCVCTSALSTANNVVVTFTSGSDGQAAEIWRFSYGAGAGIRVVDTTNAMIRASSLPTSLDLTMPTNSEYLRIRTMAANTTLLTSPTTTAGWVTIGSTRAAANNPKLATWAEALIATNTTAASNPGLTAAVNNVSIYTVFEECTLTGDGIF